MIKSRIIIGQDVRVPFIREPETIPDPVVRVPFIREPETIPPTVADVWAQLNFECQKYLSPEQCTGLLGEQLIYFEPERRPRFGRYVWMLLGGLLGYSVAEELSRHDRPRG